MIRVGRWPLELRFGRHDDTGKPVLFWLAVEAGERVLYVEAR